MPLTKDFFTNNRNKLVASLDTTGVIVVAGNGLSQRGGDSAFTFHQDSNLYYLTGVTEPCAVLVIDTVHNQEWIQLPFREGVHAYFDGEVSISQLKATSGIAEIITEREGWARLRKLSTETFYSPVKPVARIRDMYTNPHRAAVATKLQKITHKQPVDIRPHLNSLRMFKTAEELQILSTAISITQKTINQVSAQLSSYASEKELLADITRGFLVHGGDGHAFEPIVASGKNTCMLHYFANNAPLKKGDMVLLDIGAEVSHYAADISRTMVNGSATRRQTEVIAAVADAQREVITALKPGMMFKELAEFADKAVAKKAIQLGVLPKTYTNQQLREYFPHAIGHFLGLDTHDAGDYTQPIQEGMVITVEPGIYLKDEAIGVRIEDDVVITKNGAKILGSDTLSLV